VKILLTGRNGQVGHELERALASLGEVFSFDHKQLDLSDPIAIISRIREVNPEVIVNAAAYTAVDLAETPDGRRDAWASNVLGTTHLARIASENGLTLVHVSTDYVFDGLAERPYRDDDPVSPLGV
jgi:dTDP-4-dehydrorhamnose 3,5-epimerase